MTEIEKWVECVPGRCGGRPTFVGTRLEPWHVRSRLDDGDTVEDLVADYPNIPREAFEAVREASDFELNRIARMAIEASGDLLTAAKIVRKDLLDVVTPEELEQLRAVCDHFWLEAAERPRPDGRVREICARCGFERLS